MKYLFCIIILTNIFGLSLVFGQSTIAIGLDATTQTIAPVSNYFYYSASEMIFLKDEIDVCAGGEISKIRFYTEVTGGTILDNFTLYLKHTSSNTLSDGTTSLTGYTQVYSGSFPNSSTGWNEVALSTSFTYNGADNLELLVVKSKNSDNSYSSSTSFRYTSTGSSKRTRYWRSDAGAWDNTMTLSAVAERPNIQFDITITACSGTPDIGTTICTHEYACEGQTIDISFSECAGLTGLSFQWQQSNDNSLWSDISGQTSVTTSITQGTEAEKYYRCKATCSNSGLISYSIVKKVSKLNSCTMLKVGSGQTYTSLTANTAQGLFKYINTNGLTTNTMVVITSDLVEDGAVALNQWATGYQYSLTITSDDAILHTIYNSGDNNLIKLNGADKVIIDGSENAMGGSEKFLKFSNSSTSKPALEFTNSAKRDTIKNAFFEGQNSEGVIYFKSAGATQYNDSNAIVSCDVYSMNAVFTNKLIYLNGTTNGGHNNFNTINNCTLGHYCGGSTESDHGAIYCSWYSNYNTFSGNYIYNDYHGESNTMNGICIIKGSGNIIDGNTIGGNTKDGSGIWQAGVSFFQAITFNNSSGSLKIINNIIRNISTENYGGDFSGTIWGIMEKSDVQSTDSVIIRSNQIYNLQTTQKGSPTEGAITGIMSSNGQNKKVEKNVIYNLKALNIGNYSNYVIGVLLRSPGVNFVAKQNRVYDIGNLSTHLESKINGITSGLNFDATDFSNPPLVSHNMISLINSTDVAQHNGIFSNTTTSLYNNSVYIGGTGPLSSLGANCLNFNEAIAAGNSISDLVRNNIIINAKTGVGNNVAILKTNNFTTAPVSCNYNLLVSTDNAVLCRANGNNYSFTGWKSLQSLLEASSWSAKVTSGSSNATEINPSNLFTDLSTANLHINNSHQDCWFVNGKGVAISTVSNDFDGDAVGNTYGFGTDIGADEFDPGASVEPHTLTSSSNPFDFTFAGRHLATVNFSAGTPTSLSLQYYTGEGVIAPDPLGAEFFDSYMHVWPTGGSGYKYNITIDYDEALLGGLVESGDENLEIMAKQDNVSLVWAHYNDDSISPNPISSRNIANNTLTCSNLSDFSNFTGTKKTNPLPITLVNFDAKKYSYSDVIINWQTYSETNNSYFEVEKSADAVNYLSVKKINGAGNSIDSKNYSIIDENPFRFSSVLYYRLKQVDYDGVFTYSKINVVNNFSHNTIVFPNPTNDQVNVIADGALRIEVLDELGRTLLHLNELSTKYSFDLSSFLSGVYIIKITFADSVENYKILKK